jgi:hypothetical protein
MQSSLALLIIPRMISHKRFASPNGRREGYALIASTTFL